MQRPEDTNRQLMINNIPLLQYGAVVGLSSKKQNYADLEMEAKRMKVVRPHLNSFMFRPGGEEG